MEDKELRQISCDVLDHIQITIVEGLAVLECIKIYKCPGPDLVNTQALWETEGRNCRGQLHGYRLPTAEDRRVTNVI